MYCFTTRTSENAAWQVKAMKPRSGNGCDSAVHNCKCRAWWLIRAGRAAALQEEDPTARGALISPLISNRAEVRAHWSASSCSTSLLRRPGSTISWGNQLERPLLRNKPSIRVISRHSAAFRAVCVFVRVPLSTVHHCCCGALLLTIKSWGVEKKKVLKLHFQFILNKTYWEKAKQHANWMKVGAGLNDLQTPLLCSALL